jgi:hypothetical protein
MEKQLSRTLDISSGRRNYPEPSVNYRRNNLPFLSSGSSGNIESTYALALRNSCGRVLIRFRAVRFLVILFGRKSVKIVPKIQQFSPIYQWWALYMYWPFLRDLAAYRHALLFRNSTLRTSFPPSMWVINCYPRSAHCPFHTKYPTISIRD